MARTDLGICPVKSLRSSGKPNRRSRVDRKRSAPHILSLHCSACDYRFERWLFFSDASHSEQPALAA